MATLAEFAAKALTQQGKRYHFGVEVNLRDPNPPEFDCAELIEWAAFQCGVPFTNANAAQMQRDRCVKAGTILRRKEALATRGALLFRIHEGPGKDHVAISLGDGRTMEARSRHTSPQVGVFPNAASRRWTHYGFVPGFEEDDMPLTDADKKWLKSQILKEINQHADDLFRLADHGGRSPTAAPEHHPHNHRAILNRLTKIEQRLKGSH